MWTSNSRSERTADTDLSDPADVFFWAFVATLVLLVLPYGTLLVYPAQLVSTLLHESGHGLAILANGGAITGLEFGLDGTGRLRAAGEIGGLSALAGHATVLAAGFVSVWAARRANRSRYLLLAAGLFAIVGGYAALTSVTTLLVQAAGVVVGIAMVLAIYLRSGEHFVTKLKLVVAICGAWIAYRLVVDGNWALLGPLVGAGLGLMAFAVWGSDRVVQIGMLVVAAQFLLDPLIECRTMVLSGTAYPGQGHLDAATLAQIWGGSSVVWSAAFGGGALSASLGALIWLERDE